MARPREFDESEVLGRALETFWSKGYDGTSIEDLVQVTGLGRASLYGAFGSKEQLFSRVLDHYLDQIEAVELASADGDSADRTLRELTSRWVDGVCPSQGQRGCFLSISGTSGGASGEMVRELLLRAVAARQRVLAKIIARGQASGELRGTSSPTELARFLIVMQQGVAASARAGLTRKELAAAMKEAVDHVVGVA